MAESDPPSLREVKSATLQINGIMSRLQAGKMNIENAVQLCFEMTDKIDFDASNISKDVKATNTALRLEMRNIRHKNIKLMQAKYQLKSQLEKAQQKMKDFEDMNVSDVEMMSFSQSLEHSMATQEKGKETKAKNENDPNAQCSQEKEPKAEVGNDENTQSNEIKDDENNPDANDGNDKLTQKNATKAEVENKPGDTKAEVENKPDDNSLAEDKQMSTNDSQGDLFSEDGTDMLTQGSDMETTTDDENNRECNDGSQGDSFSKEAEPKQKRWTVILVKSVSLIIKSEKILKMWL